ncbi:hypothetical protein [Aeromonas salmonicida]|uniref:hypothetical protein n=1 Tax=Aeromonas salmonicida TaxID=645 RepID=UPI0030B04A6D
MGIEEGLERLCAWLSMPSLKSVQSAFTASFFELQKVRELHSWEGITKHINEKTGMELTVTIVKNMYWRAKKRQDSNTKKIIVHDDCEETKNNIGNQESKNKTLSSEENANRLLKKLEDRKKNEKRFIHDPTAKNISIDNEDF